MTFRGPCVRMLPVAPKTKTLYLTFDDGPDPASTPATLDTLAALGIPATFFVVAAKAHAQGPLLRRIQSAGHALGNHSFDHSWRPFFQPRAQLLQWVGRAESLLTSLIGAPTVGFRSPAGVQTPPLDWALRRLDLPLVHWRVRFYDAVRTWTEHRALSSLSKTPPGSIILLHDLQPVARLPAFRATLSSYVQAARAEGYAFHALNRAQCLAAWTERSAL